MARGRRSGKKSGSKPTNIIRSSRQALKDKYSHIREDAQLSGIIPTTPAEALKSERVDPATQGEDPQIGLIAQALRNGWSVPEDKKPQLVDELVKIIEDPEAATKTKVAAFNALRMADQQQYERDHPEIVSKLRGGTSVQVNNSSTTTQVIALGELFSDIKTIEKSICQVMGVTEQDNDAKDSKHLNRSESSSLRADCNAQPLDEEEPSKSQTEPETD